MSIADTVKRELLVAVALLGVGFLAVPLAVYWVGQQIVGPYESDAGLLGLFRAVWTDFFRFQPGALLLVLSPYVLVQLVRLALGARRRRDVTHVTDS